MSNRSRASGDDRLGADPAAERGTTLTEVLVILTLTAAIALPLFIAVQSAFRLERTQTQEIDLDRQLAFVVDRFETDIRSGAPAADSASGPLAEHLAVSRIDDSGSEQLVVWSVDGGSLRRTASNPATGAVSSDVLLAENVTASGSVFRYWEASGQEIAPSSVDRIVSCSVRVTFDLRSSSGGADSQRVIDVTHRSNPRESSSC